MKNFFTAFKESTGEWSMRRLMAFLFALAGVSAGCVAVGFDRSWQVVAVSFGVPAVIAVILLICTTVADIKALAGIARELQGAIQG